MKVRRSAGRLRPVIAALTTIALLTVLAPMLSLPANALGPCDAGGNKITCENSLAGSDPQEWDTNPHGTVEGYADRMSVNLGETVNFKIRSSALTLQVDIYRMGYYQGKGARKITSVPATTSVSRNQPSCPVNATTGEVSCNWGTVASWTVPATAVSGIYFAHVVRTDTNDDTHIVFVVRDDARASDLLFRTSDSTWQAYNSWGDIPATEDNPHKALNSLYRGDSAAAPGRAVKVSYNRPFNTRESTPWGRDFVFANEYPMVRWLEANGYDVTYAASMDAARAPASLLKHKVLLSVGHDEYWSAEERAAFENARDQGINLAFFSGNEVYWKTRWENDYRTLAVYKETHAGAKIDPTPNVWTGTWRDPRFSPPADGGKPENALTGTLFTVNCTTSDDGCKAIPLTVPAADGKMRFWRNTSVAGQTSGSVSIPGIVGYEWDEDIDNGFRPRGLVPLSTTTAVAEQVLIDYGTNVAVKSATHRMTMYRAPSGALVFGAGTVQWTWGLDSEHDSYDDNDYSDVRIKQATVNLFADMGVQPKSLTAGLSPATASTDTTAPTATISAPSASATLANGSTVTVSGTASDVGGRVGAVEVSTDGGATWHPATGRGSWSYSWNVTGMGPTTIKARAVDDSGNVGAETTRTVTVECPCSLFPSAAVPAKPAENDGSALELGVRFVPAVNGYVTGVKFYKGPGNTGTHTGTLWTASGRQLAGGTFENESTTGWQTLTFSAPVRVAAGTQYIASYFAPNGHYAADPEFFKYGPTVNPPLTAPQATPEAGNGVYRSGPGFPTQTYNGGNYYVDVVFTATDTFPPGTTSAQPVPESSSVSVNVQPKVSFDEPIQAGSATFTLKDKTGASVAGTATLDAERTTLTFAPAAPLAAGERFTVSVAGAKDDAGNVMSQPYSFSFTTAKAYVPGVCPCTIWPDSTIPDTPSIDDGASVELGVKFQASSDGFVEGIRFYKGPGNTGTHTATLWTATGQELRTATFTDESSQGWQEVRFDEPVPVTKDTTYVASYHAPNGHYAATSYGLYDAVVANPLRTLASTTSGGNGVYRYGERAFPNSSWAATNYWVDVVFTKVPDTTAPYITMRSPDHGANGVATGSAVTATFSEPVQDGSAVITVKNAANHTVAGSVALDQDRKVLTFTPDDPLAQSTTYTVTVSGAKDDADNTMTSTSWSFTTGGPASCPCSIFASNARPGTEAVGDGDAVEVGVKFTADMDGQVIGIRFYKGPGNTGVHVGNVWSATGSLLATGTFENETSTGWQTLLFDTPVDVTAGQVYVASYHAPNGHYAGDGGYFTSGPYDNSPLHAVAHGGAAGGNGVYRYGAASGFPTSSYNGANYWVDVLFTPAS
ncbi:hypothetical protein GCM10010116_34920 [Microbispora rosea subsp. aerata]|nr:DUF4082 domain-containing protein [Microbispora rosea]GGO17260.1 hypothetical protein GCM10010116_34920 [Microbispora rosea subsp. aerata]GIH56506.1 hypothetical protein Mro02_34200 [Microbispora rosea subsp. aerata]GLJ81964.1 hypothetical protein GCM10017588_06890 [Microbispora rosea subsp. aerata]